MRHACGICEWPVTIYLPWKKSCGCNIAKNTTQQATKCIFFFSLAEQNTTEQEQSRGQQNIKHKKNEKLASVTVNPLPTPCPSPPAFQLTLPL